MEGANIVPVMDMNRNNNYGDCYGGRYYQQCIFERYKNGVRGRHYAQTKEILGEGKR